MAARSVCGGLGRRQPLLPAGAAPRVAAFTGGSRSPGRSHRDRIPRAGRHVHHRTYRHRRGAHLPPARISVRRCSLTFRCSRQRSRSPRSCLPSPGVDAAPEDRPFSRKNRNNRLVASHGSRARCRATTSWRFWVCSSSCWQIFSPRCTKWQSQLAAEP